MNRKNTVVFFVLITAVMGVVLLPLAGQAATRSETRSVIELDVELDNQNRALIVRQKLDYVNTAAVELPEVYLNLFPNAFQDVGGGLDLTGIRVEGVPAYVVPINPTVVQLALPQPLQPGERVALDLNYTVRIPAISNRFGYHEGVYNLGNAFIIPVVHDEGGWAIHPYVPIGDAFHSDLFDFRVKLTVPPAFVVAASGELGDDGVYRAERVRDFALCLSDGFEVVSRKEGRTEITVYYSDEMAETAAHALGTAANALRLFGERFSPYPYNTLAVVLSGMTSNVGGMEYPRLIMVGAELSPEYMAAMQPGHVVSDAERNGCWANLDRIVAHEVAHQWFYGLIGNDQYAHPWLDEGPCRYAEHLYEQVYPPAQPLTGSWFSHESFFQDIAPNTDGNFGIDQFDLNWSLGDWYAITPDAYTMLYIKGASLFFQMEKQMGQARFADALKAYVAEFSFDCVTPERFVGFWNEQADFAALFEGYFQPAAR